jgi:hypothetical protein
MMISGRESPRVQLHLWVATIAAADLESSVSALAGGSSVGLEVFVHVIAGAGDLQLPED